MGLNKVMLIGNLGADPEIRHSSDGSAIANLSVGVSEKWRDKSTGEQKQKTEWAKVVLFGKLAEVAGEYLRKGSQVYIEGQLRTRKWTDQSGQEKYTTEIVVGMNGVMQMLGGKQEANQQKQGGSGQPQQPKPQQHSKPASPGQSVPPTNFDDDIPFAPLGLQHGKSRIYAL